MNIHLKILIADDCEENRFLVRQYLSRQPYELIFVENGQEALEAFSKDSFDLVLMDIQMPVMDGLKATELMRGIEWVKAYRRTPILAITAGELPGGAERSRAAGCDEHLSKPVTRRELLDAIERLRLEALLQKTEA